MEWQIHIFLKSFKQKLWGFLEDFITARWLIMETTISHFIRGMMLCIGVRFLNTSQLAEHNTADIIWSRTLLRTVPVWWTRGIEHWSAHLTDADASLLMQPIIIRQVRLHQQHFKSQTDQEKNGHLSMSDGVFTRTVKSGLTNLFI